MWSIRRGITADETIEAGGKKGNRFLHPPFEAQNQNEWKPTGVSLSISHRQLCGSLNKSSHGVANNLYLHPTRLDNLNLGEKSETADVSFFTILDTAV